MTAPFNAGLSMYANMCSVLHGYQVYQGTKPIDKWEFYADFQENAYSAAILLRQGKLANYSCILKDDWTRKKKILEHGDYN